MAESPHHHLHRELFALAAWIQTFPEFDLQIYSGGEDAAVAERIISALDTSEVTSIVAKITEVVCGVSLNAALARSPRQDGLSGNDLIWTTLLKITAARARPLPNHLVEEEADTVQLKLYVLGNLLDCAVQAPDKQLRRNYIGRIMGLPKSTQKTIMATIEQRATTSKQTRGSSSKKGTPLRSTPNGTQKSQQQTPPRSHQSTYRNHSSAQSESPITPQHKPTMLCSTVNSAPKVAYNQMANCASTVDPPCSALQVVQSISRVKGPPAQQQPPSSAPSQQMRQTRRSMNYETTMTTPSHEQETPKIQNLPSSPGRSSMKKPNSPSRGHSVAFRGGSATGFTPERKRQSFGGSPLTGGTAPAPAPFLSPGTLESPSKVQSMVQYLHQKNKALDQTVSDYQRREEEYKKKMETMESDFKQKMMNVEATSLDRYQELERDSEKRAADLQEQLTEAQEEAKKNSSAVHELAAAKEELEVLNHSKSILAETSEKLRKFKERLSELQDVKEALQKEQEAHGQAVDEIVRLENELQLLQPVKRQVEEYKIRAIEAEVKLVESQDYLRRMEQQVHDQSSENEYMFKDAVMHKDQLEELQRRIQEDTARGMENPESVFGVGDGISELNPELKEELVRLRNENLQLRAFQVKRTDDAVQHLEESLDDSKRLANRYKSEYLGTKQTLGETKAALAESLQRESDLQDDNMQWQDSFHEMEQQCANLKSDLQSCEKELEQTKASLQAAESDNEKLRSDIKEWMKLSQENEVKASDLMEKQLSTLQELEETKDELRSAEETIGKLEREIDNMEAMVEESSQTHHKTDVELEKTAWELSNTRNKLTEQTRLGATLENQIKRLRKKQTEIEETLEKERNQRKEDSLVAQESLETTRQLLEAKNRKEQEELQANMNGLLEDERKAYRLKDEEASRLLMTLEQEWHEKYVELQERSTSTLKHSRQEAQERIDFVKKEYEQEMEKLRKESSETQDNMIRKGRSMLAEAKAKATEEMQRLDDECRELDEKIRRVGNEKDELEVFLKGKIGSLQQQLQFSTSQVNERTREADEYLDQIKTLEREKYKLSEENEQYRRQLGGRYGADGKYQSQLEKLQKEYNAVVDENRNLKKQVSGRGDLLLGSISEASGETDEDQTYRRGGAVDRRALTQLRNEYEERIEALNDEKRDLIMKNASAATDVHKAEKRAWEREDEIAKLKHENTSLKLMLQRADLEAGSSSIALPLNENRSPQKATHREISQQHRSSPSPSPAKSHVSPSKLPRSSPGIDRAKKHRAAQEERLRSRFTSVTGLRVSPPTHGGSMQSLDGSVVESLPSHDLSSSSSIGYHPPPENAPTSPSNMASDVFRLGITADTAKDNQSSQGAAAAESSIMDFTQRNDGLASDGSQQECQQS